MAYYIHSIIMIVAEIYCSFLLAQYFAEKRDKINQWMISGILFTQGIVALILSYALIDHLYIRVACVIGEISIVMFLIFQIRYLKAFILSMLFIGMGFISEFMTIIILGWTFPLVAGKPFDFSETFAANTMAVISKILLFLIILFIGKIFGRKVFNVLSGREWGIIFAISFITIFSLTAMVLDIDLVNHPDQGSFMYIIMGMLAINFIVYYLINDIMRREIKLREYAIYREKARSETAMYHSISENLEKQRKRTHEYKNQIAAISALAAGQRFQELKEYVVKIDAALKFNMDAIDTNNVIVNAILNTKYHEAVSKGIVVVLKVNDLSKLNLREEDIVVILSNLLNNALEACVGSEDKVIWVKFVLEGEQIVISVKNSIGNEPVVQNGEFITTKVRDTGEHGMGIQNVVETVEKYDGRYVIDYDKEEFQFSILIPNPQRPAEEDCWD